MQFTRDDTKVIKGIAIVLMLYHHLFYFPQRISDSIQYIPVLTYHNISSAYLLGEFGKICVALFLFLGGYGTFLSFRKHADDDKTGTQVVFTKIELWCMYWSESCCFLQRFILALLLLLDYTLAGRVLNETTRHRKPEEEFWVRVGLPLFYPNCCFPRVFASTSK